MFTFELIPMLSPHYKSGKLLPYQEEFLKEYLTSMDLASDSIFAYMKDEATFSGTDKYKGLSMANLWLRPKNLRN